MELEVREEGGEIIMSKPGIESAIQRWKGSAGNPYGTSDEFLRRVRDEE